METSKKIIFASYVVVGLLFIAYCVEMCCGIDTSNTMTALMAALTEVAASNAFYFWKAKNENRHKYTISLIERLKEQCYDEEFISRIAEIIMKD